MKKIISIFTALVMTATMLIPFSAFAGESYSITCYDCAATLDVSNPDVMYEAQSAEEGQTVYLIPQIESGMYVMGFVIEEQDVTLEGDHFTMPAHSVTVSAMVCEKSSYYYDLTTGECEADVEVIATLADLGMGVDPENSSYDGGLDFDNDEVSDLDYTYENPTKFYVTQNAKDKEIKSVTRNISDPYLSIGELTFLFKESGSQTNTYTVTWQLDNGRTIQTMENVPAGETVHFEGTPTKASTQEYQYEFVGWTPAEGPITQDTTYTAVFNPVKRTRTIVWKNWDGEVLQSVVIGANETPVYTGAAPTRASDGKYRYAFSRWKGVINNTTGDTVYTAEFTRKAIPITLAASNKTFKANAKTKKYTVTLKIDGKPAKRKKISFKINKKTYTVKTNAKGQATFKIKIQKKGTYKGTVIYKGDPKNMNKNVKITIK